MGGEIYMADFGQYSMGVYNHAPATGVVKIIVQGLLHCFKAKCGQIFVNPLIGIHYSTSSYFDRSRFSTAVS